MNDTNYDEQDQAFSEMPGSAEEADAHVMAEYANSFTKQEEKTVKQPPKKSSRLSLAHPKSDVLRPDFNAEMPYSLQAEQSVLGAIMIDNQCFMQIEDKIDSSDFYHQYHANLFKTLSDLSAKNEPFDVVTISEAMDLNGVKPPAGNSLSYLGSMAQETPSSANVASYAKIVRDRSVMRRLIHITSEIKEKAHNKLTDATELLDEAEQLIFSIAEQRSAGMNGFKAVPDLLKDALLKMDEIAEKGDGVTGISTGIDALDNITHGLQDSDLIILAARPAMGKTSLALNIAEHAALNGSSAAVFSMEMPDEQLIFRLLSSVGKVDQSKIRGGQLNDGDWKDIEGAVKKLKAGNLYIDDTPALTPTELRARARRLVKEHGDIGVFIIDYLQLMRSPGKASRVEEISDISRSLKALAKELKTPVIALSQLSRDVEKRQNKRPINSDLRESGAIEQDADVIAFIYRDEVYNPETEQPGVAEIIIGKHRNGSIGTVYTMFNGSETRFSNLPTEMSNSFN